MTALTFEISNVNRHISYPDQMGRRPEYWECLVNIEADFRLLIDSETVFEEPGWTIVELAVQLSQWKDLGYSDSFFFNSMDIEETDVFCFLRMDNRFIFSSSWSDDKSNIGLTTVEIDHFVIDYIGQTIDQVREIIGIDLRAFKELGLK